MIPKALNYKEGNTLKKEVGINGPFFKRGRGLFDVPLSYLAKQ
jgi:hypothetical protein